MNKNYVFIIITYVVTLFSVFIGAPLLYKLGVGQDVSLEMLPMYLSSIWTVLSFSIGLVIILLLVWRTKSTNTIDVAEKMSFSGSTIWAILGIFLAFFAQMAAVLVENIIGVEPGSENTQEIMNIIRSFPMIIIITTLIGPILEEIVFRKVIFGTLFNRFSFHVSAVISSVIFAIAHQDYVHLILYTAMGITFSFLYMKTNRIIVPIISHVAMNAIVVIIQLNFVDGEVPITSTILKLVGGLLQ